MDPEIDESSGDPDAKYHFIKFKNVIRDLYDVLPKYQNDCLKVVNLSLNSSRIVKIDINEYVLNKILADSDPNGTENLMMYSFIDFRQLYLLEARKNLRSKSALTRFTEFEQADYVLKFIEKYGDIVEQSTCICDLIDSQFAASKTYYKRFFRLYLFGYVLPFLAQLRWSAENSFEITIALTSCISTQAIFFGLEVIQMLDSGILDYFSDFWNMIDIFQCCLFWYYASVRLVRRRTLLPDEIAAQIDKGLRQP